MNTPKRGQKHGGLWIIEKRRLARATAVKLIEKWASEGAYIEGHENEDFRAEASRLVAWIRGQGEKKRTPLPAKAP